MKTFQELLSYIDAHENCELGGYIIKKIQYIDNQQLELIITKYEPSKEYTDGWAISVENVKEVYISTPHITSCVLLYDHPLLYKYNEQTAELYIYGQATEERAIINQLLEIRKKYSQWIDVFEFLNEDMSLASLLSMGHGKFAEGPLSIISQFALVLKNSDIKVNIANENDPVWWNGAMWITENRDCQALLLDSTYIIASHFR